MAGRSSDAGPSTYARHRQQTSSVSNISQMSHSRAEPPSPLSPRGDEPPTHVQAIHDFSPALLASASVGQNANMYLSFMNGEVIRVHARDPTGWWDGEIATKLDGEEQRNGPRRGWFPSNFVREMGHDGAVRRRADSGARSEATTMSPSSRRTISISTDHARHSSSTSHTSRASSSTSSTTSYGPSPTERSMSILPPNLQSLLHPVVRALSLLDTAIHADRKTHIQPAAAACISAIRTVLLQTDCFNKYSETLTKFPVLGKERKTILAELSRMVAAAKTASSVPLDGGLPARTREEEMRDLEKLAKAARAVFAGMKRFLQYCNDYNLEPDLTLNAPMLAGEHGLPTPGVTPNSDLDDVTTATFKARTRHSSNEHSRMQATFKARAASVGDLRAARRQAASSPPPPIPNTAGLAMSRGPSAASGPRSPTTPVSATFPSTSSGRSSPISFRSKRDRKALGSMDSTSTYAHSPVTERHPYDQAEVPIPPTPVMERALVTSADVLEAISEAEDSVLSIIAAFIGHIHSHHIGSHPSSHAILIEMTREVIDCVRELLTVVEAVGRDSGVRRTHLRELEQMRVAKDTLYEVSNRLVEGVELIAHAPFTDTTEEDYSNVKAKILSTATATLRAGTDCVRWVRSCVPEGSDAFGAAMPTPRPSDKLTRQATPRPLPQDAAVVLREKIVGQRGTHTLSGLHRKASSLSLLQKRFNDGSSVPSSHEGTEDEQEDEEVVADAGRDEDVTVRHVAGGPKAFPGGSRPPSIQTHGLASIGQTAPRSAGLMRTLSDLSTPLARSRSSSLTSPVPARMTYRSPSRSADLDKFTGDYGVQLLPRRPSNLRSSTYQGTPSASTSNSSDPSHRTSGVSDQTTPSLLTPHDFDQGLRPQDGAFENALTVEVPSVGALPKFASLSLDTVDPATEARTLPRPAPPHRAMTAPFPGGAVDPTFFLRAHDYEPQEVTLDKEGIIVGASLKALVEKMTPHDGPVDPTFSATFFLTFRLHTSPKKLAEAVMTRYDLAPPHGVVLTERDRALWVESKVVPVRLRIYNFLKAWLDSHWRAETDDVVLETLHQFNADVVSQSLPAMAPRLDQAIRRRQAGPLSAGGSFPDSRAVRRISSVDHLGRAGPMTAFSPVHTGLPPTPSISRTLNSLLHKNPSPAQVPITDFDTLELARQLTIMESKLFCLVAPEDLLQTGYGKKSIPELKALSTLSNQITGWVADTVLNETDAKKRALLLKFYIKLSDKCLTLNNFSTLFAVMAGLNSSIVHRLTRTWDALSIKYKLMMDRLQSVIDHTKNHAVYRARLRDVEGPCLPFLGIILSEVTFTSDGNPDTRPSTLSSDLQLINQDKFARLGRIAIEFGRYQQPFNLHELEIVQSFLRRTLAEQGSTSLDALYRKSLLLEPRQGSEKISSAVERPGWLGGRI